MKNKSNYISFRFFSSMHYTLEYGALSVWLEGEK